MRKIEIPSLYIKREKKGIKLLTWLLHKERLAWCPNGMCGNTSCHKKILERDLEKKQTLIELPMTFLTIIRATKLQNGKGYLTVIGQEYQ